MIEITGTGLRLDQVADVARLDALVSGPVDAARLRMEASLAWVEEVLRGDVPVYGINTGFGGLAGTRIASGEASQLSRNVILKCCVGVGTPLPPEVVRAMMVIRADTLAHGTSGVRPVLVETLVAMLNAGVTPVVPSKGSLGASGDLAPLAHIAAVLTRGPDGTGCEGHSGRAWYGGELLTGEEAMRRAGIERVVPGPKEGLALTNGTTFMLAAAVLSVLDAENLLDHADSAAALSLEALGALSAAFDPELNAACNQPGQEDAAARIRSLLAGSRLIDSDPSRMQDAYSLRCIPQVHGPVRDAVDFIRSRVECLLKGTSDNPLVFASKSDAGRAISGGNFHGQGLAFWHDLLGIVMAEIASLSERRTFRLLTPELSGGLPAMLVPKPGLDSGLMMVQYTQAALVADNKVLAHPDSVDSIPSSANQEDHVSMGANAARHSHEILDNVRHVLAIEFMTAAQGVDLRPDGPARLGAGTAVVYAEVRRRVETLVHDRALSDDIDSLTDMIRSGSLRQLDPATSDEAGL
ncbi:MAG: histidine ammonia-lyase [Gemmatimonadales bacterium]|nr:MAG: histidine ammonia-lyase [Gemmatimonadales bacterium]